MKRTALVGIALAVAIAAAPTTALAGPPRGRPPAPRQHRPAIGWLFRWFGHQHGHYRPPAPRHENRGRHRGWQQGRHNGRQRGRHGGWNPPGENGGQRGGERGHGGR